MTTVHSIATASPHAMHRYAVDRILVGVGLLAAIVMVQMFA